MRKDEPQQDQHTTILRTDEPVTINIGDTQGWFRVWNSIVLSGRWAEISAGAKAVLVVLAQHANRDWMAFPGNARIQRFAGIGRTQVKAAIRELERAGLVVVRGRGVGRLTSTYQIVEPGGGSENRPSRKTDPVEKPARRGSEIRPHRNRLSESDNSSRRGAQPAASGGRATAAAGDQQTAPAIAEALTAAEIGEPARSRLAALEGMSVVLVERTVRKCQDKPGGVLIRALEAAAEAAVVRRRRAAERRAREGVGVPPAEEPEPVTGEAREQGLQAMREALGRRLSD